MKQLKTIEFIQTWPDGHVETNYARIYEDDKFFINRTENEATFVQVIGAGLDILKVFPRNGKIEFRVV